MVARLVRDQEVACSSHVTSTIDLYFDLTVEYFRSAGLFLFFLCRYFRLTYGNIGTIVRRFLKKRRMIPQYQSFIRRQLFFRLTVSVNLREFISLNKRKNREDSAQIRKQKMIPLRILRSAEKSVFPNAFLRTKKAQTIPVIGNRNSLWTNKSPLSS